MIENPKITAEMLSAAIGITAKHIKKNIKKPRDVGFVDRIGTDKNGDWIVKLAFLLKHSQRPWRSSQVLRLRYQDGLRLQKSLYLLY